MEINKVTANAGTIVGYENEHEGTHVQARLTLKESAFLLNALDEVIDEVKKTASNGDINAMTLVLLHENLCRLVDG